jgi:lipopolysaccharide/colanic/teichoic acid biosynthesis glycosyltransferase
MSNEPRKSSSLSRQGPLYELLKRGFDLVAGLILLAVSSPLLLVVAGLIRAGSSGRALYRQERIGRDGRVFHVYKFRTMYRDADQQGPLITASDDSRVTPIGRFLRETKIDELPQLMNVVRGEMSLVGPRPQVPRFVRQFSAQDREVILSVRPGITGPTQLEFRHEEEMLKGIADREGYYIEVLLPIKCRMDAAYVQRRSLGYDLMIVLKTVGVFLSGMCRRRSRRAARFETSLAVVSEVSPRMERETAAEWGRHSVEAAAREIE